MTMMRRSARAALRRRWVAAATVLIALLISSCASLTGTGGGDVATPVGPELSDVEPLEDPGSYVGESTAVLGESAIQPVANNPEQQLPVTITDAQGTEVTVSDTSRILALDLYGTTARAIFELGLGDFVVGRDISSGFEEIMDRPLMTQNGHDLNAEALLQAAPSVIITDTSLGPWDVMLQMRDAGIPVVVVDSKRTIESTPDLIRQIAAAVGLPDEGEELALRTESEVADMTAQIAEIAPKGDERLRMIFLYVRGQSGIYYMFGPGSGTDSLITAVGGLDVATEIGWEGMKPMTDEGLIAADPDLVIMMTKGLESVDGVDGLLERLPALAATRAGQNRRIVDMSDTEILSFGSNSADVLEALAVAIYAPEDAVSADSQ